jgi:addiction module RelE/StbE family toxin
MKLIFHRDFERSYANLRSAEKEKCDARLAAFFVDTFDKTLNNHPLRGTYMGYRSINIAGDLRAIYRQIDAETYFFIALGPHKKLYQ